MRTLSTLILLSFACVARAAFPLSGCSAGTAVQNTDLLSMPGSCGYGMPTSATGSWATTSIAVVSEDFYGNGQRCGQCFEVVGPLGSTIVTVVSYCPKTSDERCNNPNKAHFALSTDAFNKIANATTDFLINDLGYRQVSCPISGDVSVAFPGTPNAGYLPILPYNARIAISTVEVKGSSWANYEMATRNTNSGSFSWNKRTSNELGANFNLRLTANTGEKLVTSVTGYTSTHNSDKQFSNVPEVTEECRLGVASPVIFNSQVTPSPYGNEWKDDFSFLLIQKIIDPTDNSLKATMGGFGAVQFTRSGNFDPVYWSSLTFTAKASVAGYDKLRVYLGTDTANAVAIGPMTAEYATYTVSFADFTAVQPSIVIQNNDGNTVDVWFNYVALIRNDVPADAAPLPTTGLVTYTTTANPPGTIGNSQNNPIGGSDSENGAASTTATVAVALLVVFACLM